jgi:hypothetical protein
VNQGMRRQNLRQARERPSGGEKKTAARELVALCFQACPKLVERSKGKQSGLGLDARDKGTAFGGRHFRCRVVGLSKFVGKHLNEVDALAREDGGHTSSHRERDESSPAGMGAEPQSRAYHKTLRRAGLEE